MLQLSLVEKCDILFGLRLEVDIRQLVWVVEGGCCFWCKLAGGHSDFEYARVRARVEWL